MSAKRLLRGLTGVVSIVVVASLFAACSGGGTAAKASASASGDPTKDKLAQVQARGTLVLYTDPAYPPQSMAVEGATRAASTKCAPNQMTAPEITRARRRAVFRGRAVRRGHRRRLG